MITPDGVAKMLDFGLAKRSQAARSRRHRRHDPRRSRMGTPAYMAPEQAAGEPAGPSPTSAPWRYPYEMVAGRRPFDGKHAPALLHAIRYETRPPELRVAAPALPEPVRAVVMRSLAKRPGDRPGSVDEIAEVLGAWRVAVSAPARSRAEGLAALRRPIIAIPLALLLIAAATFAIVATVRQRRAAWARDEAVPAVTQLIDEEKIVDAFDLAMRAQQISPDDPVLARLLTQISRTVPIRTEPAGATVVQGLCPPGVRLARRRRDAARQRFCTGDDAPLALREAGVRTVEAPRLTGPFLGLREIRPSTRR